MDADVAFAERPQELALLRIGHDGTVRVRVEVDMALAIDDNRAVGVD